MVPKIVDQYVEKIVEVPQVQVQERLVQVPKVEDQEIIKEVPKLESPQEHAQELRFGYQRPIARPARHVQL